MGTFHDHGPAELIARGCALLERGELDAALEQMSAAAEAAPGAAAPLAWMADIVSRKLYGASHEDVQRLYPYAEELARDALARDDNEDRALSVLGRLARLRQLPTQAIGQAAGQAIRAGNQLMGMHRFEDAQRAYEEASRAQPELAEPVKYAGNCQFAMARHDVAEWWFRRAIELDPLDAQAHHFLADACFLQGNTPGALAAALAAIAANPAYYPAWQVVRSIRESMGRPLRRFRIRPLASISEKEKAINVSAEAGPEESAAWLAYAVAKANRLGQGATPFALELQGLSMAAAMVKTKPPRADAPEGLHVLWQLAAMEEKGYLPLAILVLAYDESYRGDLEGLKRQHPGACADFVHRHDLRPY